MEPLNLFYAIFLLLFLFFYLFLNSIINSIIYNFQQITYVCPYLFNTHETNLVATANQTLRKTIDVLLNTPHVGEEEIRHHSYPESPLGDTLVLHLVIYVCCKG